MASETAKGLESLLLVDQRHVARILTMAYVMLPACTLLV